MQQHENAISLIESIDVEKLDLNEATTRTRIIDTILYDVMSWPKNAVTDEEHSNEGYLDYILKNENETPILIIEAKKEGIYFETPKNKSENINHNYIKMKTLLTNGDIKNAINQVRRYSFDKGCMYAAITNGHVWIFFKVFDTNWESLNAFVIYDLEFFDKDFTVAYNTFNYTNLVRHKSLQNLIENVVIKSRKAYSIRNQITSFSAPVDLNLYAQYISRVVKYYFSDFDDKDDEFLKNCYVDEKLYENTKSTLTNLLIDNATPYLENSGVINYERDKLSKRLSKKITNFADFSENKHIVVIYGDRGCGKSTFIKKLINADIPKNVHDKLEVIYIDLLKYAAVESEKAELKSKIWNSVIEKIDIDEIRNDYSQVQDVLFPEEFKKYKKQISSLYQEGSEIYGMKLEDKIVEALSNREKLAFELAKYLREEKNKEIVLIVDNTDQFSAEIQDFCFQIVAEIFASIKCLSIITIREERFFRSKNLGVLDAYETIQYHISSPRADKVFLQRLNYLINSLDEDEFFNNLIRNHEVSEKNTELVTRENFKKYFIVFKKDFDKKSNLYTFLSSCAQKDMRKALDLFRELLFSGYLNIYEMISTERNIFTLQVHQVLKPLMTPKKYFYEEDSSSVPNIFKLRNQEYGSHFTSIRVLNYLNKNPNDYLALSVIKSEFNNVFNMEVDFDKNIEILIEYKLIEANIKVDNYIPEIEEVIITPFGKYFIQKLIHFFTYLDLVCTDCSLYDEQTSNYIARSANNEYKLFSIGKRGERMVHRVEKTNHFIKYLIDEEKKEIDYYNLDKEFVVMEDILEKYKKDIKNVKNSSLKQNYSSEDELKILNDFFDSIETSDEEDNSTSSE